MSVTIEPDEEHPLPMGNRSMAEIVYDQSNEAMPINIQPISIEPMEEDTGSDSGSAASEDNKNGGGCGIIVHQVRNRTRFTEKQVRLSMQCICQPFSVKPALNGH